MSYRWMVGQITTGKILADLDVMGGSGWTTTLNAADDLNVSVKTNVSVSDLRLTAAPGRSFLACAWGDNVLAAGPIWTHSYAADEQMLQLRASGMLGLWGRRYLLPVLDGARPEAFGMLQYRNMALGTIMKRIVQLSLQHPGGGLPIDFEADIVSTNERNYLPADLATVGERLMQLNEVDNGPDLAFRPRFSTDRTSIRWTLNTGTPQKPHLGDRRGVTFDYSAEQAVADSLRVEIDASNLTSRAFSAGGAENDDLLTGVSYDPYLVDYGYPLLESLETMDSKYLSTLDRHARGMTRLGRLPIETWSARFGMKGVPAFGNYGVGDFVRMRMKGDGYLPDSPAAGHPVRVVRLSGSHDRDDVTVAFAPERS